MAQKPKKTLYHSELVQLGPVEVEVKSDVLESKYGKSDYVVFEIDGYERQYNVENSACGNALDRLKGQVVIIEATGSRDDAEIIVSEPTGGGGRRDERQPDRRDDRRDDRRNEPRREERNDRRQERREEAPPARQERQPANKPAATVKKWVPMGQTVGMAINNACQSLTAQGLTLEPKRITEIASDILRVAKWLEAGNLIPKAPASGSTGTPTTTPQKPAQEKPTGPADQTAGQTKNAEAPQPGPHEPPPDDDVPF